MTENLFNQLNGWINLVTFHASLIVFNEQSILREIDSTLKNGRLLSPEQLRSKLRDKMPEHLSKFSDLEMIDSWDIQRHRFHDLLEANVLDADQRKKIEKYLTMDTSMCFSQRRSLLKGIGAPSTDPHFDHSAFLLKKIKGAKKLTVDDIDNRVDYVNGDMIMLVEDYMNVPKANRCSDSNSWIERTDAKMGDHYICENLFSGGNVKVTGLKYHLNANQFKKVQPNDKETENDNAEMYLPNECALEEEVQEIKLMKVQTIHYVNDKDISTYSVDQQVTLIATTEARIAELKSVKAKSKVITAEIAKLQDMLKAAVELFDSLVYMPLLQLQIIRLLKT